MNHSPLLHRAHDRGQALPMFVFFMLVLFLFVGLGIDLGFAYITKANLSKAVDAACLEGMNNISQGTITAGAVASSIFAANYGKPGRDTAITTPTITWSVNSCNNQIITVSATAQINTFFIRVLPSWKTFSVSANAQATERTLIMSLVLDDSGSMKSDGGSNYMPGAVSSFIGNFDNATDWASMTHFTQVATTDVPIGHNFINPIIAAAKALTFPGYTGTAAGLTNALVQNQSVSPGSCSDIVRALVVFTDGMANTFVAPVKCGAVTTNVAIAEADGPPALFFDATTGATFTCSPTPTTVPSINGGTVSTTDCVGMHNEACARALAIANQARAAGIIVYAVGLGNSCASCGECGGTIPVLNPNFLEQMANDPNYPANYNPNSQPSGLAFITYDASNLTYLFQEIAADIRLRLTQ